MEEEEKSDDPLIIISENEKKYIKEKGIKGEQPYLELCLDNSNLVGNLATLALSFPELNDMSKEKLEGIFQDLPNFTKKLFILFIKLFNNSIYNGDKEEALICQKFSEFIENVDFIKAVENNYDKKLLLKDSNQEEDKIFIGNCKKIKKDLNNLSNSQLQFCEKDDDIIKEYLNEWNTNFENYIKDLDDIYFNKIGKEEEHKIKLKIDKLIEKLKTKKSKIDIDFVKSLLDDMIEYLTNITEFTEDNYLIAESDVNKILKDAESYISSSSKTTYVHFPIVPYNNDLKPEGDFQRIYTLLMDFSDTHNLLRDFKNDNDKRTCMNLGKLKRYLKIQEPSTLEGIKKQYNILYDKIMGHSDKIIDIINDFEDSVLSNLIMNIYEINKNYLNKNYFIEKLNNYCSRNKIKENDLEWASFLSKTRDPFDEILLPMFNSNSIIKLFSLKNEKGENMDGMYSKGIWNNNKLLFFEQLGKLLKEEELTKTLTLTIQTIFQISMITIYKDKENINNVDEIQKIFQDKILDKINEKEEFDIIEVIQEIKEKIKADQPHKELLDFIIDLFKYLVSLENIDLSHSHSHSIYETDIGDETKDIIDMLSDKKDIKNEEDFSNDLSKSILIPDFNITKIVPERIKEIIMDDTFFLTNPKWKIEMKPEYKKYPSFLYFLFKYPSCEEEMRPFLLKTDSINEKDNEKFPTFLLILRIFSNINCLDLQFNTDNFLGKRIKEEILLGLKNKSNKIFQKSPDINWLALLINNSEINNNKYISQKMHYIYKYLENICDYQFKPDEESEKKYNIIIKKMIESLLNIIFEGKIENIFSEEISIKKDENSKEKINDILYLTKLPNIIQI